MSTRSDRRPVLADCAIELLAEGGARALTHQGIDRRAGIPAGSTSYYFRTRAALIEATINRIRDHSRAAFEAAVLPVPITVEHAAVFIGDYLVALATDRRQHAIAIFALLPEVNGDPGLADGLRSCLFSVERAKALLGELGANDPADAARDVIAFLIGLLFDHLFGRRAVESGPAISVSIRRFIRSRLLDGDDDVKAEI